jgi:hypothetical protein
MKKLWMLGGVVLLAALLTSFVGIGTAGASTLPAGAKLVPNSAPRDTETFTSDLTNQCLGAFSGQEVTAENSPCAGPANSWDVNVVTGGWRTLGSLNFSGHCLDDSSAGLRIYPCNGLSYQHWGVSWTDNGVLVKFQNQATGLCMVGFSQYPGVLASPCDNSSDVWWY